MQSPWAESSLRSELGARSVDAAHPWPGEQPLIPPDLDPIGRWRWPHSDDCTLSLLQRAGQRRVLLVAWLEDLIAAIVPLDAIALEELSFDSGSIRSERLRRFKLAAFSLHVEEHFSRTKRQRDQIIYSMLRCRSQARIEELALAIREGELDFSTAAIRYSEGPESAQGGRIGPISPQAGHPELNRRLDQANEGDLLGPFPVGDVHVLLRLDTRITTRLDEPLQQQLIEELYQEWLARQLAALESDESIEPLEYLPAP